MLAALRLVDKQRTSALRVSSRYTRRSSARSAPKGFNLNFPSDLSGISGSPVWAQGTNGQPILSGIQTAVYPQAKLIKVTKADFLYRFIGGQFPELRPAIRLARAAVIMM